MNEGSTVLTEGHWQIIILPWIPSYIAFPGNASADKAGKHVIEIGHSCLTHSYLMMVKMHPDLWLVIATSLWNIYLLNVETAEVRL